LLVVFALLTTGCSKTATKETFQPSAPSGDLFAWERPTLPPPKLPITQSATCSFKKGLAVSFERPSTWKGPPGSVQVPAPNRIYYSQSDENEADTVAFLDLDTKRPMVLSNGGQASLSVVYDDGQRLTLLNSQQAGAEMYTIFRNDAVVIYTQQKESGNLGPFGVIMMGYCH